MKISLAMIVKNVETTIERCLESVMGIVDEIIIVDTGSTDRTIEIINHYGGINLYHFEWCGNFSLARNFSIEKTTSDYVLVLDGDEYLIKGSRNELEIIMQRDSIGRILINSHFYKDGQDHYSKAYVSRFFPKDVRYEGSIHEQLVSNKPRQKIDFILNHDGYLKTDKSERNIPLLLKEIKNNPKDAYYLFQLGKELRIKKQYDESYLFLIKSYRLSTKRESYYGELIVELIYSGKETLNKEVLEIINDNERLLESFSDFHFAKGLFFLDYCLSYPSISNDYINLIENSFLICLELNGRKHNENLQGSSSFLAAYNLGVYYEVTGNIKDALRYYRLSLMHGYPPARKRIEELTGTLNE